MNAPENRAPTSRIWCYDPMVAESRIANVFRAGTMAGIWFIGLAMSVIIGTHVKETIATAMAVAAMLVLAGCSIWLVVAIRDAKRAVRLVRDGQPANMPQVRY